jgi:hypothetical protein
MTGDGIRVAQTSGDSDRNRCVHSPRSIHAVNDGAAGSALVNR